MGPAVCDDPREHRIRLNLATLNEIVMDKDQLYDITNTGPPTCASIFPGFTAGDVRMPAKLLDVIPGFPCWPLSSYFPRFEDEFRGIFITKIYCGGWQEGKKCLVPYVT